jgi:acyl carrier protein
MMTLDDFCELFCDELEDTDIDSINALTDFKNIENWDSLTALSIIAMIDEEFEILLTGNDMRKSTTIEDLYNLVKNKLS